LIHLPLAFARRQAIYQAPDSGRGDRPAQLVAAAHGWGMPPADWLRIPPASAALRPFVCVEGTVWRTTLNKTAKDGKRFKRGLHAMSRVVSTPAAFAIVRTYLGFGRTAMIAVFSTSLE